MLERGAGDVVRTAFSMVSGTEEERVSILEDLSSSSEPPPDSVLTDTFCTATLAISV